MEILGARDFWFGLVEITWINIILSGDNAVVIALAARSLGHRQQRLAVLLGAGAAVVLRVVLTLVASKLLALPWLQVAGGVLLLWIGVQLLGDEDTGEAPFQDRNPGLMAAIRTILVADVVMSLDNVIAVAAAAHGSTALLVLGLALSVPLVVFGATLMVGLMTRFPFIVVGGAALIGWVAGETIASDAALEGWVAGRAWVSDAAAAAGALVVLAIGRLRRRGTA